MEVANDERKVLMGIEDLTEKKGRILFPMNIIGFRGSFGGDIKRRGNGSVILWFYSMSCRWVTFARTRTTSRWIVICGIKLVSPR